MLYLLNGIELNGIELNGIELNGIEETHHGGVVARGFCRAGHSQHLGGAAAWLDRNNETHVQHLLLYVGLFFSRNFTEGVSRRI